MRVTPSLLAVSAALGLVVPAAAQAPPPAPPVAVKVGAIVPPKADPKAGEAVDQRKADLATIASAGYTDDVKSLTDFFRNHTVTEEQRGRITGLIQKLADDSFDVREAASEDLARSGVPAIALLRAAMNARDADYEVARRCELALKVIEKVPTRTLAMSAARLLANKKDDGITEALLNYLPLADDDSVSDEIRNTLAALAVRDGKPDRALDAALQSPEALKRGAAAEAFARANDPASRARMKELLRTEKDDEIKLLVALALVESGRDKTVVPDVIRLMADVPTERGWRAEELLWRLAGEDAPGVSLGGDQAGRDKARDEWQKWWAANEAKVDLARLDQDSSFGLTIVCETPARGGGMGRIVALGPDGKERWKLANLAWPMDAVPLAGKKVLIAEHNRNRVVERDIDEKGKEVWSENINQPLNVGRLPNGVTWAIGRNQVIEWERGDKPGKKQVFSFTRNEFDIVGGARTKTGEYVLLTQQQQLLKVDRQGSVKSFGLGGNGVNYYSTVDVMPNGKALVTHTSTITEYDIETGKSGASIPYQGAMSAVRLRNGNTLVANQNARRVIELDKEGKPTKWQYTSTDNGYRPFRAFKR